MDSKVSFVYVTVPDENTAKHIAEKVVEARLAACANILPGMKSIYHWQGQINTDDEVVLILKTRATHFQTLANEIKKLHPYECPCIVALPVVIGEAAYMQWILDNTKAD